MEYPVFETRYGPLGIAICREMFLYPEVSRIYAVKGVRILINPFAGPDFGGGPEDTQNFVLTQLASRVHENQSFVLSANLVGAQGPMVMVGYSSIMGPSPKPELMTRHIYAGPASMTEQEILIAILDLSIVNSRPPGVATVFEDRVPRTYRALV
jgi:predicted amidohydrolase